MKLIYLLIHLTNYKNKLKNINNLDLSKLILLIKIKLELN